MERDGDRRVVLNCSWDVMVSQQVNGRSNAGRSNALTWERSERQRAAYKSNRSVRGREDSSTWVASKRGIDCMANTTLPDDQEGEAMAWCEKELREHWKAANKSNRSTRGRVDSLTWEESKAVRESAANVTFPDDQEGESMAWCEKEAGVYKQAANKSKQKHKRKSQLTSARRKQGSKRQHGKHNVAKDWEGEAMAWYEKQTRELEKEARELEIAANTLLLAATRVYQCITTSKRKSQQYCGLGVASFALIAGRIAFTCEGLREFLQEPEHLKEKVLCILSVIIFLGGHIFPVFNWTFLVSLISWQICCKYNQTVRKAS